MKAKITPPKKLNQRQKENVLRNMITAAVTPEKQLAMEGCRPSQKVILEGLQAALKPVDMPTELPIDLSSANAMGASIMQGVASGQLSTSQAKDLVGVFKDISELSAVEQMQSELLELKWFRSAC